LAADKACGVGPIRGGFARTVGYPYITIDGRLSKSDNPRETAMDRRTTRHPGYAISQCCCKRIQEVFGWGKTSANLAKVK